MDEFQTPKRPTTFVRLSRAFFSFPIFITRRFTKQDSCRSTPVINFPQETPSSSSASPMITDPRISLSNSASMNNGVVTAKPLLRPAEIRIISQTLNKALKEVDFGNEVVIRLLNDKRSLFKSLLARCAQQAHEIEVFDAQSLARFCPRAVQVGDGVTRFFERVAIVFEKEDMNFMELEQKLSEMCRANGQLHFRMKVWFQAENWLCVKHSVVDTVLMANSNLKRGKQLRSASDLYGFPQHRKSLLNRIETMDNNGNSPNEKHQIEVVWMKLMQAVIAWMKQGFLESALNNKEEADEQL